MTQEHASPPARQALRLETLRQGVGLKTLIYCGPFTCFFSLQDGVFVQAGTLLLSAHPLAAVAEDPPH